ncbi:hypothetical protein F383_28287 [Gossypium arboreum]|uniref:Uncharacterized protein n=1 Tax=Gossypium arboreum TaxID=29729 RepID=A0A0B0MS66_GOSAR|nr:hypothetical protein F383_28287 [Gossypium arboreum]
MQVIIFLLLHLLMLSLYWRKTYGPLALKLVGVLLRSANSTKVKNDHSRKCSKIISNIM